MSTTITVTNRIPALHCWPNAHVERAYLREPHRHLFVIRTRVNVSHDERDVEFHDLQGIVASIVPTFGTDNAQGLDFGPQSCETLARRLLRELSARNINVASVAWSEDDENTAEVTI